MFESLQLCGDHLVSTRHAMAVTAHGIKSCMNKEKMNVDDAGRVIDFTKCNYPTIFFETEVVHTSSCLQPSQSSGSPIVTVLESKICR